jgi:hypothetical protein
VIAPRYALLQKDGVQATLSDIKVFMVSDGGKSGDIKRGGKSAFVST